MADPATTDGPGLVWSYYSLAWTFRTISRKISRKRWILGREGIRELPRTVDLVKILLTPENRIETSEWALRCLANHVKTHTDYSPGKSYGHHLS